MSFIELTRRDTTGVTVNTEHIATFATTIVGRPAAGEPREVVTEIMLIGQLPAHAFIQVTESYEEVRRIIGLDWMHCGEGMNGDICDRRLTDDGRCPIHGQVGA